MANGSSIQVSSGTGPRLATSPTYTESSNVVQDEKVILGLAYHPTYSMAAFASAWAANGHALEVMAGASLNLYVYRIVIQQQVLASAATAARFQIIGMSSASTGGTVTTSSKFDTTDAVAGATGRQNPTSLGVETAVVPVNDVFPFAGVAPITNANRWTWEASAIAKAIRVPAGVANGLAIKALDAVTTGTTYCSFEFLELPF